jgi:hypothetical protein
MIIHFWICNTGAVGGDDGGEGSRSQRQLPTYSTYDANGTFPQLTDHSLHGQVKTYAISHKGRFYPWR